jgi:hypothetical protein
MSQPWLKFYPSDWRSDPALRMCSIGAHGLWIGMLCVMHEAGGFLRVNGVVPTESQLAMILGWPAETIQGLLGELEAAGVFSRDETGTIYSRRMVRDIEKAAIHKANGLRGGNPSLNPPVDPPVTPADNQGVNPPVNQPHKPPDNQLVKGGDKAQIPDSRVQTPESDSEIREPEKKKERARAALAHGWPEDFFEQFWSEYPHKQARPKAKKALERVAKSGKVGFEALMAGLERYKAAKPEGISWAYPATWINDERWDDKPAAAARQPIKPRFSGTVRGMVRASNKTRLERFGKGLEPGDEWYDALQEDLALEAERKGERPYQTGVTIDVTPSKRRPPAATGFPAPPPRGNATVAGMAAQAERIRRERFGDDYQQQADEIVDDGEFLEFKANE